MKETKKSTYITLIPLPAIWFWGFIFHWLYLNEEFWKSIWWLYLLLARYIK